MDSNDNCWKLDSIKNYLSTETINKILLIPIRNIPTQDKFIWPHNKDGEYTVKSGYHVLHSKQDCAYIPSYSTSHTTTSLTWKLIWKIKTLPRINHFLWKCVSNTLPCYQNLWRRKLTVHECCPICGVEDESTVHALLLCPWVKTVWFGSECSHRIEDHKVTTIDNWLLQIYDLYKHDKCALQLVLTRVSFVLWAIWKTRCEFIYQGLPINPTAAIRRSSIQAGNFLASTIMVPHPTPPKSNSDPAKWEPPPLGTYKINCDAAWTDATRPAGLGVVIRDSLGKSVAGSATTMLCNTAEMSEAEAILEGIKLSQLMNLDNCLMASDSKTCIEEIKSTNCCRNWEIFPIILEIRARAASFRNIDWIWNSRKANQAAHVAASLARSEVRLHRWATSPPPLILMALNQDTLVRPPE